MRRDGGVPSFVQEPPDLVQISRRCLGFGENEAGMFFDHSVTLFDFRLRPSQELRQGSVGGATEPSPSGQLSSADRALRVSEAASVYCYESQLVTSPRIGLLCLREHPRAAGWGCGWS